MRVQNTYDAIVVGSGVTGGWAAKELTERGLRVLVLEAGRTLSCDDARADAWLPQRPPPKRHPQYANQPIQIQHPAFHAGNRHFFVDDTQNPYLCATDAPFVWIRGRQVGGRSMVWGGQTWRLSDLEFKAAARDGLGVDWPIGLADLQPHYERVERVIRVRGDRDGLATLPDSETQAPARLTEGERRLKRAVEMQWPDRHVIGVRSVDAEAEPDAFQGATCWPRFSSPGSTLAAADRTGLLTIRPDAVVSHLLLSADHTLVRGVCFIDARDQTVHEVFAKSTVLCASTLESTRILLNTGGSSRRGIGNHSGCLGRYLMDHVAVGIHGTVPGLSAESHTAGAVPTPAGARGIYIPRFRDLGESTSARGFRRGYGVWGLAQRALPPESTMEPASFSLLAIGEMLANPDNHVELSSQTDAWGIPTLRIYCRFGDNEHRMAEDADRELRSMAASAGFLCTGEVPLFSPGRLVHEVGTARMGGDRRHSYLNSACQSWEIRNLFVTDGACWPTSAYQNPTLTMMAITSYACVHIHKEIGRH